ncbi:hypothetical protein CIY_33120 [Butyrivibrio fibrisolvens 16/4]|nr:hypothetical protein CIY_33120 [Butyrivibrio fibrisolvens 16/4]
MENLKVEEIELEDVNNTEDSQPSVNVTSIELDNGEDLLLSQIDAFREKATQLQQLILAKEQKAAELEALVKEKKQSMLSFRMNLTKTRGSRQLSC